MLLNPYAAYLAIYMDPITRLVNHLQRFVPFSEKDIPALKEHLGTLHVGKKEHLVEPLQPCNEHYFVVEGCLRMYFFNEKGDEQTVQFAIEDWWITDHAAYTQGVDSHFCIQAVESSTVLTVNRKIQEDLFRALPALERYFRIIYQRAFAAAQYRMRVRQDYSGEDTYLMFKKSYPDFVDRVPQYMLASYLGITPEYLSVVKKRHA
ncbi:Crp/Fnr family transcriptional regulator [Chryseolinea sp. T2]|uniref:Crp/Fnr family transcriptional regulator n=1 Tax=Chryseolinea sp. T2 TaxID=3129255 RepID=UPI003076B61C